MQSQEFQSTTMVLLQTLKRQIMTMFLIFRPATKKISSIPIIYKRNTGTGIISEMYKAKQCICLLYFSNCFQSSFHLSFFVFPVIFLVFFQLSRLWFIVDFSTFCNVFCTYSRCSWRRMYRVFQLDMLHCFKRLLGHQKSTFKA